MPLPQVRRTTDHQFISALESRCCADPQICHSIRRLRVRFFGWQGLENAESHHDSSRAIAHVPFHVAIHAEPDSLAAKLHSGPRPTVRSLKMGTEAPLISWLVNCSNQYPLNPSLTF